MYLVNEGRVVPIVQTNGIESDILERIMKKNHSSSSSMNPLVENRLTCATELITKEVYFSFTSGAFPYLVHYLYLEMRRYYMSLGLKEVPFSEDIFSRYCQELVVLRIKYLNGNPGPKPDSVQVPKMISQLLFFIGNAKDRLRGLCYQPILEKSFTEAYKANNGIISKKDFSDVTFFLSDLSDRNVIICSSELPRSKEGNVDFMSTVVIDGFIRNAFEVNPECALYASILANIQLDYFGYGHILYYHLETISNEISRGHGVQ